MVRKFCCHLVQRSRTQSPPLCINSYLLHSFSRAKALQILSRAVGEFQWRIQRERGGGRHGVMPPSPWVLDPEGHHRRAPIFGGKGAPRIYRDIVAEIRSFFDFDPDFFLGGGMGAPRGALGHRCQFVYLWGCSQHPPCSVQHPQWSPQHPQSSNFCRSKFLHSNICRGTQRSAARPGRGSGIG